MSKQIIDRVAEYDVNGEVWIFAPVYAAQRMAALGIDTRIGKETATVPAWAEQVWRRTTEQGWCRARIDEGLRLANADAELRVALDAVARLRGPAAMVELLASRVFAEVPAA